MSMADSHTESLATRMERELRGWPAPDDSLSGDPHPPGRGVSAVHLDELRKSGLSDETIDLAGVYTEIDPREIAKLIKWKSYPRMNGTCLVFPFFRPGERAPFICRVKPSHPRLRNGRLAKYESPAGGGMLVYLPPRAREQGWFVDTKRRLVFTEGEKKSLALDQLGFACVGLTGVDCFHDGPAKNAGQGYLLHPTIRDHVTVAGRTVVICYDADSRTKADVMRAAQRLCGVLLAAGAVEVRFACPPSMEQKGVDDLLFACGSDAVQEMLAASEPIEPRVERPRPTIRIGTDLDAVVDAAVASLASDIQIYQLNAQLVHVVSVAEADASRARMSAGTPQIRALAKATLRERLSAAAVYKKHDARKGAHRPVMVPSDVAECVAARGEWATVRPITGVIATPTMRPDGSVIDSTGYDPATGYVLLSGREYPPISERPTLDDARAALLSLVEPFLEFPFCSEPARYVPVAAIMTLVARPAIVGAVPAALCDASTRGSGKSLLARAISTLAQGREAAVMSWPGVDDELEKVLGSYALRGASVIAFDNVTGTFGGAPLDKVLTCADRVELRVLGESKAPSLPWRATVLAGGNNVTIGGDTSRRVLVSRLEPMTERPEERTDFRIRELAAWCCENHPRIVSAVLTLLRGYIVAGRPPQSLAGWGSFEAFRDLVCSAIVWAGGPDVMACRPTIAGTDDAELAALKIFLKDQPGLAPDGMSAKGMIDALYAPERMRGHAPPDGHDALREAIEVLAPPRQGFAPAAQKLGYALRGAVKRVVGGRYIASETDRNGVARWVVKEGGS